MNLLIEEALKKQRKIKALKKSLKKKNRRYYLNNREKILEASNKRYRDNKLAGKSK